MLLATSMVLSSVSVAPVLAADEVIFEEVGSGQESASDEVSFGDDFVVEEQNEEDGAAEQEAFFDEVIEDDQVTDDVIAEDTADDQEAYAFEEPIVDGNAFVGNEDVLEAITNEEPAYAKVVATGNLVAQDINEVYDGQEYTIKVTNSGTAGTIVYAEVAEGTIEAPESGDVNDTWTSTVPKFKNVINTYYFVGVMKDNKIVDVTENPVHVQITKKTITAKMKDKTFVYRDYAKDMEKEVSLSDLEFTGLVDGEDPTKVLEFVPGSYFVNKKWGDVQLSADGGGLKEIREFEVGRYKGAMSNSNPNIYVRAKLNPVESSIIEEATVNYDVVVPTENREYVVEITKLPVTLELKNTSMELGTDPNSKKYISAKVTAPTQLASYFVELDDVDTTKLGKRVATVAEVRDNKDDTLATDFIDPANLEITPATIDYEVTQGTLYVGVYVNPTTPVQVTYGTSVGDALKSVGVTKNNLYYYTKTDAGVYVKGEKVESTEVRGTAQFATDYEQFKDVSPLDETTTDDDDDRVASYRIWYTGGLTRDGYTIAPAELSEKNLAVYPTAVYVTTEDIVVGVNDKPVELKDQYVLKDASTTYKGAADALKNDIASGRIAVTMTTDPEKPSAVGSYPISVTFEDKSSKKTALSNYIWKATTSTAKNYFDITDLPTKNKVTSWETTEALNTTPADNKLVKRYTVAWGDFNITFSDYEGKADGQEHGITTDPDPLPNTVVVYYVTTKGTAGTEGTWADAKAKYDGYKATPPTVTEDQYIAARDKFISKASTNMPTRKEVGTSTVYYFATSTDYKTASVESGLNLYGSNTITILDGAEGDAKEVEKKIDEATKRDAEGKLDPEKVKEAEDAYNALSDAAKKEVSPASKKKLEDAVAEVKDDLDKKAAKEVEDAIDKLPAATEAKASDKEAADAAKEAYDKLTDDQKKLVPADKVKKMNDVKAAADEAAEKEKEEADKKAAKAVEDEIDALPDPDKATADDKAAADKAAEDLAALTDEQKALVPQEKQDKVAAVKAAADKAAEKKAADQAEADKVTAMINDLKSSKPGEGKSNTEDARKAYDALTDDQKALVPEDAKKELETSEQAYAKDRTFTSGEGIYRVLSNGDVTYLKPVHPDATYIEVPNQVKKGGRFFKVIKISSQAFKGCSKVTKIWAGKNIVSIGSYAFKGATGLKKLILRSQDIKSGKVENAFTAGGKDKGASLTVQVWSSKMTEYESLFKGEGGLNSAAKLTAIS